jgi:hypothetical protein
MHYFNYNHHYSHRKYCRILEHLNFRTLYTRLYLDILFVCLFPAQQPSVGHGLLIHEVSRSQRRTTVGRTPLDEWSARRRDLYLTTHNTRNRQTSWGMRCLCTGLSDAGYLWRHEIRFRFHKVWSFYWLVQNVLAFQKGRCTVGLVRSLEEECWRKMESDIKLLCHVRVYCAWIS